VSHAVNEIAMTNMQSRLSVVFMAPPVLMRQCTGVVSFVKGNRMSFCEPTNIRRINKG
jgi:hypothetical protein